MKNRITSCWKYFCAIGDILWHEIKSQKKTICLNRLKSSIVLASTNNVLCTVGKLDSAVCYLLMTKSQMLDVRISKVDMVLKQCLIHLRYG